jgi:predicted peroxiredoxin
MDATIWALEGTADSVQVEGFEPLKNYIDTFFSFGGNLMVCAPCSEYYCSPRHRKVGGGLIEGAELAGLTTVVSKAEPGTTVVTF